MADTGFNAYYYCGGRVAVRDQTADSECWGFVLQVTGTTNRFVWWNGSAWQQTSTWTVNNSNGWPAACIGSSATEIWVVTNSDFSGANIVIHKITLTGGWAGTTSTVSAGATKNLAADFGYAFNLHKSMVYLPTQGKILVLNMAYRSLAGYCSVVTTTYDITANTWSTAGSFGPSGSSLSSAYRTLGFGLSQLAESRYVWFTLSFRGSNSGEQGDVEMWRYDATTNAWTFVSKIYDYLSSGDMSAGVTSFCAVDPNDANKVWVVDAIENGGINNDKRRIKWCYTADGFTTAPTWALLADDWVLDDTADIQRILCPPVFLGGADPACVFVPMAQTNATVINASFAGKTIDVNGVVTDARPLGATEWPDVWGSYSQEVAADLLLSGVYLRTPTTAISGRSATADLWDLTGSLSVPEPPGMAAEDYETTWTTAVRRAELGARIRLDLGEDQTLEDVTLPAHTWEVADAADASAYEYPRLEERSRGQPVPIVYGTVYDLRATCIDTDGFVFRVASNALSRFLQVRVDGVAAEIVSQDLTLAQFTLADWDGTAPVTADLEAPTTNPADVIEDLLDRAGIDAVHTPTDAADATAGRGFGTFGARTWWLRGTWADGTESHRGAIGLALTSPRGARAVCEQVAATAAALLYIDRWGRWTLRPWVPPQASAAPLFTTADVFRVEPARAFDELATRVVVHYAQRWHAGTWQTVTVTDDTARHRLGLAEHVSFEVDAPLANRRDALALAGRELALRRVSLNTWRLELGARAMLLRPGDGIRVQVTRPGQAVGSTLTEIDAHLEVLSVAVQPGTGVVQITATDWRGLDDRVAHYTDAAAVFPTDLGGGSAATWSAAWTDAQKRHARENLGHYLDSDGFGGSTDPDSYRGSTYR